MAELAILMPSQNYSMLFETRATRSIDHVYSVYLVTAQYSEASHEWQEVPIHQGNVTTCHIGINAKPFHEPPPHTWALNHYICLAVLMQVMLSGRLKFTLHWSANTKSYLCPLFSELQNVTWSVGTTYCIRINAKAFHLAPHKNDTFVPQGS